jgi:hypothetical protein
MRPCGRPSHNNTWTLVLAAVRPGMDQTRHGLSIRAGSTGPEFSKNTKTLNFRPAGARTHRGQRKHAWLMRPCGRPFQNTHGHWCLHLSNLECSKRAAVCPSARGRPDPKFQKITKTLNFRPAGARAHRGQSKHAWPMRPCGRPFQNTHGHRSLQLSNLESTKRAAVWRTARGRPDPKFQKIQKP